MGDISDVLRVVVREMNAERTLVEVKAGDEWVSRGYIGHLRVRIGKAVVRADTIEEVETRAEVRGRGYGRKLMEAAIEHMRAGDAGLSMIEGIADFYPKFGYATAGGFCQVSLNQLNKVAGMPAGWVMRRGTPADSAAVQELYARGTAESVGAAVRPAGGLVWGALREVVAKDADECRVVVGPDGQIHGYAWHAGHNYLVRAVERQAGAQCIAEVMADGPVAADAVLDACALWAQERAAGKPVYGVVLGLPPEGAVARAAVYRDAWVGAMYQATGKNMVRVLDAAKLLRALEPELDRRAADLPAELCGLLRVRTEAGAATLHVGAGRCRVEEAQGAEVEEVVVPQTALARLVLGAFDAEDLLVRAGVRMDSRAGRLMVRLFPRRVPHVYWADRR